MSQVDLLYRLQHIDDEIRESKRRLAEVVRLQTESSALKEARQREGAAAAKFQKWRARQTDLNLELKSLNDKARRSEQRLYSGVIKNPKELTDLQQETESLVRRRQVLEDELLETMIIAEEAEADHETAAAALRRIAAEWQQSQQDLQEEQAILVQRINELNAEREQQAALLSPSSLAAYQSAVRSVGPLAVVALSNGRCRGCQVRVPANLVKAADEGQLVTCDNCSRILCPA